MRHAQVASGSSRIVCPATIAFGMTAYRAAATNARRLRVSRVTGEECGEPVHEHDVERYDQLHLDPAGDHSDRVAKEIPEDGRGQQDKRNPGRVDDREVGIGQVAIEQQSRGRVVDAVVVLEHAE